MLAVGAVLWTVALLSGVQSSQAASPNQPLPEPTALPAVTVVIAELGSGG